VTHEQSPHPPAGHPGAGTLPDRNDGRPDEPEVELARLAATQHGHFTRVQAAALGVGERTVQRRKAAGLLREPQPGVYVWASQAPTFLGDCTAAVLSLPRAAVAGRAAAALHGLDGFASAPVEVVLPRGGANRRQGVVLHRVGRWWPDQVVVARGLPVTSLPWTMIQLARILDRSRLEHAVDDAMRLGMETSALRDLLARSATGSRQGATLLTTILDMPARSGVVPDSWFERLVEHVLAAHDLPEPVRQHRVMVNRRFVARVDLAYPVVRVAVEAQSHRYHGSASRQREDRRRFARLRDAGWEVVEWWWDDLADPAEAVALVRAACRRQAERYRVDPVAWIPRPAFGPA
jgi:very-short-patch-repair endonuclease